MPLVETWASAWANQPQTLDLQSSGSLMAMAFREFTDLVTWLMMELLMSATGSVKAELGQ